MTGAGTEGDFHMHTAEYRVRIEAFEGPLDLLLYLIRRAEVEITEIPVGAITDQYMEYMRTEGLASIDIEKAGEFLVMAATLVEIKSRMLMPPKEGAPQDTDTLEPEGKSDDPRAELVRQLLAYKKFRDAAESLQHRLTEWESRYPAHGAAIDKDRLGEALSEMADVDLEDLDLVDLVEAFARVIETVDMNRVGEHHVTVDDTPIEIHAEDILDRLKREGGGGGNAEGADGRKEIEFVRFFTGKTRIEVIGLFMAMLELVRQRKVRVKQDISDHGGTAIVLALADPEPTETSAA
jgi:segregation and condensation protein A